MTLLFTAAARFDSLKTISNSDNADWPTTTIRRNGADTDIVDRLVLLVLVIIIDERGVAGGNRDARGQRCFRGVVAAHRVAAGVRTVGMWEWRVMFIRMRMRRG
jgi:hypothetical protein